MAALHGTTPYQTFLCIAVLVLFQPVDQCTEDISEFLPPILGLLLREYQYLEETNFVIDKLYNEQWNLSLLWDTICKKWTIHIKKWAIS